jgi:hypothetical protein
MQVGRRVWNYVLRYDVAILGDLEETCDQTSCLTARTFKIDMFTTCHLTWPADLTRPKIKKNLTQRRVDEAMIFAPWFNLTWKTQPVVKKFLSDLLIQSTSDWTWIQHFYLTIFSSPIRRLIKSNSRTTLDFKFYIFIQSCRINILSYLQQVILSFIVYFNDVLPHNSSSEEGHQVLLSRPSKSNKSSSFNSREPSKNLTPIIALRANTLSHFLVWVALQLLHRPLSKC